MIARTSANRTETRRETTTWKFGSLASALCLVVIFLCPALVSAQTTSFTYQGRFTESGTAANGTYDMQFKLFDTATVGAGNQIGSTITNGAVVVSNGVFTVQLDYGAAAFSGADRYLEIGVRPAGDANPYTVLAPRQQLTSAVYAIRAGSATTADTAATATTATTATNATQLGGVAASQYVQTADSRLTDARTPTKGSNNYIQNTLSPQIANFTITGNGTAGALYADVVSTNTNYGFFGVPLLSVTGAGLAANSNLFLGLGAGAATTPSAVNEAGNFNSFFGRSSGAANTTGSLDSFFGFEAGKSNNGFGNSFFGYTAGHDNTNGNFNSFFGNGAGSKNLGGHSNSFFGTLAGQENTSGRDNVFVGYLAGRNNTTGSSLTLIGASSVLGTFDLTNATAIGANAKVSQSNSLVLGSINGVNSAAADTNVGIGTSAPNARLHIAVNGGNILMGNAGCASTFVGIGFGASLAGCANYSLLGNGTDTIINRPTGGGIHFRENNTTQMSIAPGGAVSITTLGAGGVTALCRNFLNQISTCSSSLRYKTNIQPFISGLSVLNRLRPITFDWKQGGMHDLGFGAEDIAAVEPLLVTRNDKGEVEGVKYDRITAVLVNAVKEQQEQIKQQQSQIESLKKLVCQRNRRAAVCK